MNITALISVFAATLASLSAALQAPFLLSEVPMTHAQAVEYCAERGSRLADINWRNREQAVQELNGYSAWVASWNYNYFSNQCLMLTGGSHIGPENCDQLNFAMCNAVILYDSNAVPGSNRYNHSELMKSGPACRKPAPRPCPVDSSSSSSSCIRRPASSDSSCESSSNFSCGDICGDNEYEYVFLTQTVTTIVTAAYTITPTQTITTTHIIGTIPAFTVSL